MNITLSLCEPSGKKLGWNLAPDQKVTPLKVLNFVIVNGSLLPNNIILLFLGLLNFINTATLKHGHLISNMVNEWAK